jgi:hypothetical protein
MLCTDKEMGNEFDKAWYDIAYGTPMYSRHYLLVTKYGSSAESVGRFQEMGT